MQGEKGPRSLCPWPWASGSNQLRPTPVASSGFGFCLCAARTRPPADVVMRKMFDGWALRVAKGRSRSLPVVGSSQRKTELEGARQILTADAFSCIPRRQLGLCCFRMPLVGPFPRMRLCQSGLKLACHTRDVCRTDYPSRLISQERRIILIVITSERERETRTPSKGFVSRGPTNFAS